MVLVDANIVLRYMLLDHAELAEKAIEIIEKNDIFLPFEVVAEIVYVLEKVYKVGRHEISRSIRELLLQPGIHTYDSEILHQAIEIFSTTRMDFVDTLLCGYSIIRGEELKTFDKEIEKYLSKQAAR